MHKIYRTLCHFSMTPYGTITQQVNDVSHTTPAKRGPKIGHRARRKNVISGRGLFRLDLNISLQIAEYPVCTYTSVIHLFDQHLIHVEYYQ